MSSRNRKYTKILVLLASLVIVLGVAYFVKNTHDKAIPKVFVIDRPEDAKISNKRQDFSGTGLERISESNGVTTYRLTCYYRSGDKKVKAVSMGVVSSKEHLPSFQDRCF